MSFNTTQHNFDWALRQVVTPIDFNRNQRARHFYIHNVDSTNYNNMTSSYYQRTGVEEQDLTSVNGKLVFDQALPGKAISYKVSGASNNQLELRLLQFSKKTKDTIESRELNECELSTPLRFHFDYPILPNVQFYVDLESKMLVCLLVLGSGILHKFLFDSPNYFNDKSWGLFKHQSCRLQHLSAPPNLFHLFDSNSFVVACEDGNLFHFQVNNIYDINNIPLEAKEWKLPLTFTTLPSIVSRFTNNLSNSQEAYFNSVSYQPVDLASLVYKEDKVVISLGRDHQLRFWSSNSNQLILTSPIHNFNAQGFAIELPSKLLPITYQKRLEVIKHPDHTDRSLLIAFNKFEIGYGFLVYDLKFNSNHSLSCELNHWMLDETLTYNDKQFTPQLLDFTVTQHTNTTNTCIWTLWKMRNYREIRYHKLDAQTNTLYDSESLAAMKKRWLPVVTPTPFPKDIDPEVIYNCGIAEIKDQFCKFVASSNRFSRLALYHGLELYLKDCCKVDSPSEIIFNGELNLVAKVVLFIEKRCQEILSKPNSKADHNESYQKQTVITEWCKFISKLTDTRNALHLPMSLAVTGDNVVIMYGDAVALIRPCEILEVVNCHANFTLPSYTTVLTEKFINAKLHLQSGSETWLELQPVVETLQLLRKLVHQGPLKPVIQAIASMSIEPGKFNMTQLTSTELGDDIFADLDKDESSQFQLEIAFLKLSNILPLLNYLIEMLEQPSQLHSQIDGISRDKLSDRSHLELAFLTSAVTDLATSRFQLVTDLATMMLLANRYFVLGRALHHDSKQLNRVLSLYHQYHTLNWLVDLTYEPNSSHNSQILNPNSKQIELDLPCQQFFDLLGNPNTRNLDRDDDRFAPLNVLHDFLHILDMNPTKLNLVKDYHSYGLTMDASHLVGRLNQLGQESLNTPTAQLLYQLLTWFELKGLISYSRRLLQVIPNYYIKSLLLARSYLKSREFNTATKWFDQAATYYHVTPVEALPEVHQHPFNGLLPDEVIVGGQIAYFLHVATWLQAYSAYPQVTQMCRQGLLPTCFDQVDNEGRSLHSQLYKLQFDASIELEDFDNAYIALIHQQDKHLQYQEVDTLIRNLCFANRTQQLYNYAFPMLEDPVDACLWQLALNQQPGNDFDFFDVMHIFYIHRGQYKKAGFVKFHHLLYMVQNSPTDDIDASATKVILELQLKAVYMCLQAFRLDKSTEQWIKIKSELLQPYSVVVHYFDYSEKPYGVVDVKMINRLYTLMMAAIDLQPQVAVGYLGGGLIGIDSTIELLLEVGWYEKAVHVAFYFGKNMVSIFRTLAKECVSEFKRCSNLENPQVYQPSLERLRNLLTLCANNFVNKHAQYELVVLEQILNSQIENEIHLDLPEWLLAYINSVNQPALIPLLLKYGRVDEAVMLFIANLSDALESRFNIPTTASPTLNGQDNSSTKYYFSVHLANQIFEALRTRQVHFNLIGPYANTNYQDKKQLEKLQSYLDRYLESLPTSDSE